MSELFYGCTTWILMKYLQKKLDDNNTRMLYAVLNESWEQNPVKQQLYSYLPPISQTIQEIWARHAGHCWKSKDEFISNILQWTPTHGHTSVDQLVKTYIIGSVQKLDSILRIYTEWSPIEMNGKKESRESVQVPHYNDDKDTYAFFSKQKKILFLLGVVHVVHWLKCWTEEISLETSCVIIFTFGQIPEQEIWTSLSSLLRVKYYHCCSSTRIA